MHYAKMFRLLVFDTGDPVKMCRLLAGYCMWGGVGGYRELRCNTPRCFVFWCLTPCQDESSFGRLLHVQRSGRL